MKWQRAGRRYELYYTCAPGGYELVVEPHQGMFAVTVCLWNTAGRIIIEKKAWRDYEALKLAKAAAVRLWKRVAKEQGA